METETMRIEVNMSVSNQPRTTIVSTSTILIYLEESIQELIEDESGMVTHIGSYRELSPPPNSQMRLKARDFTSRHLSQLLDDADVPSSEDLGETIAHEVEDYIATDNSLKEPLLVTVNVNLVKEKRRRRLPPPPSSRGALTKVLHRLVKEQRVESLMDMEDTCSICIDKLSSSSSKTIIRMPRCLHTFHRRCLFKWLRRHKTCPLCRRVPYEEEHGTEETHHQRLA